MKRQPEKLEILLKCISDSPFKEQLIMEIMNSKKESYIQGSNDCHAALIERFCRGEYICNKCGLRKNDDHQKADF